MKKLLMFLLLIIGVVEGKNNCNLSSYTKKDLYMPILVAISEGDICKEKKLNISYCYFYYKDILKFEDMIRSFFNKEKLDKEILKNIKKCIISKKIKINLHNCKIKVDDVYFNSIKYEATGLNGLILFGNEAKKKCFDNKFITIP